MNLTGGFGYYNVQRDLRLDTSIAGIPLPDFRQKPEITDYRGYVYTNVVYPQAVLGASVDRYREEDLDVDELNPKVGTQWAITPDVTLRAAYFSVVKPPLVANRTLEPTQVAGFNQFFDDINATKSTRWGADWAVTRTLSIGAEMTWREFDEPTTVITGPGSTTTDTESGDEELHRLYAYWTPFERWAFTTGLACDKYKIDRFEGDPLPEKVETISAPLTASYFHPGGFFAGGGLTYVHQKVDRLPEFSDEGGSRRRLALPRPGGRFWLVSARGAARRADLLRSGRHPRRPRRPRLLPDAARPDRRRRQPPDALQPGQPKVPADRRRGDDPGLAILTCPDRVAQVTAPSAVTSPAAPAETNITLNAVSIATNLRYTAAGATSPVNAICCKTFGGAAAGLRACRKVEAGGGICADDNPIVNFQLSAGQCAALETVLRSVGARNPTVDFAILENFRDIGAPGQTAIGICGSGAGVQCVAPGALEAEGIDYKDIISSQWNQTQTCTYITLDGTRVRRC